MTQRSRSDSYRSMVMTARDLADSFHRFERDMARFRRMATEAEDKDEVMYAVMEGCDNERRRKAIETINDRLGDLDAERWG